MLGLGLALVSTENILENAVGLWILAFNNWNDAGIWVDSAIWND